MDDLASMLSQASQGHAVTLPTPPPAQGDIESSVIDVGGPRYSPAIPKGEQGSQVAVSPGQAGSKPPPPEALTSPPPPAAPPPPDAQQGFDLGAALAATAKGQKYQAPESEKPPPLIAPENPLANAPPGAIPPIQLPPSPPQQQGGIGELAGNLGAMAHQLPRALLGQNTIDYGNAALQTPFHMLGGMQGPGAAFNEALAEQRRGGQTAAQYPEGMSQGTQLGMLGAMATPGLGWGNAATMLGRAGQAASFLGRNAGYGGLMAALNNQDPTTGALLGAAIPGAMIGGHVLTAPYRAVANSIGQAAPIWSPAARDAAIGRKLNEFVGTGPSALQTSPVGPLNLAQATANPNMAAYTDLAATYAPGARAGLQAQQRAGIAQHIGQIGTPSTVPDAAIGSTGAVQRAEDFARTHERSLWQTPQLNQYMMPSIAVKTLVGEAANRLPIGLSLGVTGNVKRALNKLATMPDRVSVGDLNSVRSALRQAGRYTETNPQASAVAKQLESVFVDGMDRALSSPTVDPAVRQSWMAARDYTRRRIETFGAGHIKPMLNVEKDASQVGQAPFKPAGAPEGPAQLTNVARLLVNTPGGKPLAADVIQSARVQIATALRDANTSPAKLQDFLKRNGDALTRSGILNKTQVNVVKELTEYADMLRKPDELLAQVGSATQARQARGTRFVDQLISPVWSQLARYGGAAISLAHGHPGHAAHSLFEGSFIADKIGEHAKAVEEKIREATAEAIFDVPVADALMRKASPANRALLTPYQRTKLDQIRVGIEHAAASGYAP
jgi:hypothetical protein